MEEHSKQYSKCAWCRKVIRNSFDIANVTIKAKDDIEYESGQYITKIILLNVKKDINSFANYKDYENEPSCKEIPVFIIPYRDDEKDISINTCSYECSEEVKAAIYIEDYVYQWTFS